MPLSTSDAPMPLWLEPKGSVIDEEAAAPRSGGVAGQPSVPFRKAASRSESLEAFMARPNPSSARGALRTRIEQPSRRPRKQKRAPLAFYVVGLCLVGLVWFHVWLRLQVVRMGYVLSSTTKLHRQIEHENRELKVELATLTSPDRLEVMARRRLGLVPPEKGQVIVLP